MAAITREDSEQFVDNPLCLEKHTCRIVFNFLIAFALWFKEKCKALLTQKDQIPVKINQSSLLLVNVSKGETNYRLLHFERNTTGQSLDSAISKCISLEKKTPLRHSNLWQTMARIPMTLAGISFMETDYSPFSRSLQLLMIPNKAAP